MIIALIYSIIGIALIIPEILIFIFSYKRPRELKREYEKLSYRVCHLDPKDPSEALLNKKCKKLEKLIDFYANWIGYGWGKKVIYSIIDAISKIAVIVGVTTIITIMIKLPLDRAAYANWDRTVDYYNNLSEPTSEDIKMAERFNTRDYKKDDFIFLNKAEKEHIETYKIDTFEMWRKFYKKTLPIGENLVSMF